MREGESLLRLPGPQGCVVGVVWRVWGGGGSGGGDLVCLYPHRCEGWDGEVWL